MKRTIACVLLVLVAGCSSKKDGARTDEQSKAGSPQAKSKAPAGAKANSEPVDPALADIPLDPNAEDDPARLPKPPAEPPLEVAARYILISHVGAQKAVSKRSKQDALARAKRIAAAARQKGADFVALAKKFSEAPKEARGKAEVFHAGSADKAFADAAMSIGVGQVADPVATDQGVYVIQRVELEEYSTAHILVVYKGAELATAAIKRTEKEARARAEKIAAKAKKPGASFALLASTYSDSPSKVRGGVISPIRPMTLLKGFEPYLEAVRKLKPGEVSDVVKTIYGFHVIKRLPNKKILVRHVLIAHDDGETKPKKKRSKRAARALAIRVRKKALEQGADFAALAREYSDGPSAERGGLLPPMMRGQMVPKFEQYAFALDKGQVSDVVETKFGYHVIKRVR